MSEVIYEICSEVDRIVEKLVEKIEDFRFIDPKDIVGLSVKKDKSKNLAKIRKIPAWMTPLLKDPNKLLMIEVWESKWSDPKTTDADRGYIIIHELSHVDEGKKNKYKLKPHDVEDWKKLLKRTGFNMENTEWINDILKKEESQPA